jgi:hypothetical protein
MIAGRAKGSQREFRRAFVVATPSSPSRLISLGAHSNIIRTKTRDATVGQTATIMSVLQESSYRNNARKLQEIIAKTNGLSVAADLVEKAFGVPGHPIRRKSTKNRSPSAKILKRELI